jgi:hypothetical protein
MNKNLYIKASLDNTRLGKYLVLNKEGKICIWNTCTMGVQRTLQILDLYITNDEDIKIGDWIYYTSALGFCKTTISSKGLEQEGIPAKKIILTTDQDLIKEGVQAIDDEFLQWFVNNPSLMFVEVVKEMYIPQSNGKISDDKVTHELSLNSSDNTLPFYRITIPKEEPKALTKLEIAKNIAAIGIEKEPIQETLEEAAKEFIENTIKYSFNSLETKTFANRWLKCVVFGAKWQAERMYSEEEVINLLQKYRLDLSSGKTPNLGDTTKYWFKQFKK